MFNTVFYSWEVALVFGPALGLSGWQLFKRANWRLRGGFHAALIAVLLMVCVICFSPLSFRGVAADGLIGAAGYVAFCVLGFSARSLGRMGKAFFFVSVVPMGIGILLGTIGMLGVAFVVGDTIPKSETWASPQYSCRFTSFGNATTRNGGMDVTVLYHPTLFSAVEWRLNSHSFNDADYKVDTLSCSLEPTKARTMTMTAARVDRATDTIKIPLD